MTHLIRKWKTHLWEKEVTKDKHTSTVICHWGFAFYVLKVFGHTLCSKNIQVVFCACHVEACLGVLTQNIMRLLASQCCLGFLFLDNRIWTPVTSKFTCRVRADALRKNRACHWGNALLAVNRATACCENSATTLIQQKRSSARNVKVFTWGSCFCDIFIASVCEISIFFGFINPHKETWERFITL